MIPQLSGRTEALFWIVRNPEKLFGNNGRNGKADANTDQDIGNFKRQQKGFYVCENIWRVRIFQFILY